MDVADDVAAQSRLLLLRPLSSRAQQISRNHLRKLANVSRRHAEDRCRLPRVAASSVKRAGPEPLQQAYVRVGEQRDLAIGKNEILLLVESADSLTRGARFSYQVGKGTRAKLRLDVAEKLARIHRISRADRLS